MTSAVNAALYADRAPERQWQSEQSTTTSQITALTTLQTALSSVSTDLGSLNDITGPLAARAVSSSATEVTGTAAPGAAIGLAFGIRAESLATAASWYSPSLPSSSSTVGTSNLTITQPNGTHTSFNVGSGVSPLSDLANAINLSGIGVNASVVSDASGSRLALVSANTGSVSEFGVSYGASNANSWSSASLSSSSAPLAASSFQLSDGSSSANVTVSSGDSLSTYSPEASTGWA